MNDANQVRAVLAQFYVNSAFDHKAFLDEMEARAKLNGTKLTKKRQCLLARIVAAYVAEREAA
jgi:hypothetical protein